jgi:hypothetical protein
MISDAIFTGNIELFNIYSIQASVLFVFLLTLASCISIFIGSRFNEKYNHKLHIFSSLLGLIFGFSLYFPLQGEFGILLYSLMGGVALGLGISNLLAGFISKTNFNNRGSTSGLFTFLVFIVLIIFTVLVSSLREIAIILVILKIFSLFLSFTIKDFNFQSDTIDFIKTTNQTKFLFLIIWVIFNFSNVSLQTYLQFLLIEGIIPYEEIIVETGMISQVIGLITILIGGIFMDIYGRKKLMMFSFAYLGANYAIISFSEGQLYYFSALDGIAWGILMVLFLLILWGDVCKPTSRTIWISVVLFFTLITYPLMTITPYFIEWINMQLGIQINTNYLFPFTSFFLFIAVVIILYLPETLPEKIIQKKELDDYIKMAKRVEEKYKNGAKKT